MTASSRRGRQRAVRVGVVGCGGIAAYAHLPLLAGLRDARLVAAADPDPAAKARVGKVASIPVYERAEDLLARPDVEAVVIAAPTSLHAALTCAAAAAGKHVYVEKPLATTRDEALEVIAAVEHAGVASAVGFNRRMHPLFRQARALLRAGTIGRVHAAVSAFCEPASGGALPEWKRRRDTGGGVLLDLASHHFDLVRWLLDEEIHDVTAGCRSGAGEDDAATVRLRLKGGAVVHGIFSFRAGFADFLEVLGEDGTLRVDRHRPALDVRVRRRRGYGVRRLRVLPPRDVAAWRLLRPLRRVREPSYRRALQAFVALVRGEGPEDLATLDDGLRSLEGVLAAEQSARSGAAVLVLPTEQRDASGGTAVRRALATPVIGGEAAVRAASPT